MNESLQYHLVNQSPRSTTARGLTISARDARRLFAESRGEVDVWILYHRG